MTVPTLTRKFLKSGLYEPYRKTLEDGTTPDPEADPPYDAAAFVRDALQVRLSPTTLDQFAQEYDSMVAERNAHASELHQLRVINAKLSNQVRKLEASLAQTHQEHVELVRQVVHARLAKEDLESQLVKVKCVSNAEWHWADPDRLACAEQGIEIRFDQ